MSISIPIPVTKGKTNEQMIAEIQTLNHKEMAYLYRFAPVGHTWFKRGEVWDAFKSRWDAFGGWNSQLSKEVGW